MNRIVQILRKLSLLMIGIVIIVVGIITVSQHTENYLETTAKVTKVTELPYDEDNGIQYDVEFSYTVDGREYTGTFSNMPSGYTAGQEISVFYDPQNPEHTANSRSGKIIGPVMIGIGALVVIIGVVIIIRKGF